MAVNMEVEKNTSKEVDTQLLASNSMQFNDGIRNDDENVRDLGDQFSPLGNKTIDSEKCGRTVIYRRLEHPDIYAKGLDDNRLSNNEKEEECIGSKEKGKEPSNIRKVSKNDCNIQRSEVTPENSTDGCVSQAPLAFTIDFGNKEMDTTKYQNLFERYNARHKRNLSMSKVDTFISFEWEYVELSGYLTMQTEFIVLWMILCMI